MKSSDPTDHFVIQKKECKKQFRKSYRIELAKRQSEEKFKIISTRTRDSRLFHKLVNKQREHGRNSIEELQVGKASFSGTSEILQGFRKHFESLANGITDSKYDEKYHNQVLLEVESIKEIVKMKG